MAYKAQKTKRKNKKSASLSAGERKIDPSAELPTGEKINGLNDISQAVLDRQSLFSRNLTKKLLTFAVGREPNFRHEAELKEIVVTLEKQGNGFQDLLKLVINSDHFHEG